MCGVSGNDRLLTLFLTNRENGLIRGLRPILVDDRCGESAPSLSSMLKLVKLIGVKLSVQ